MRWYSPAGVMDRAGAMCALVGPCRFGRPTGGGGIVGSNSHVPISSDHFKVLLGIDGHPDKCFQQSIVIRRARSAERAVEAGKRRYERRCHVAHWSFHADGVEMEIDLLNRTN